MTWDALQLRGDMLRAQREMDSAVAVAEPALHRAAMDEIEVALDTIALHLVAAERSLASAQRRTGRLGPVLAAGAHLPGWPRGLREIDPLLAAARELARAGMALSDGSQIVLAHMHGDARSDQPAGARVAQGLAEAEPAFIEAAAAIERALAARRTVDGGALTGPLAPGATALARFDEHAGAAQDYATLLTELPAAARSMLGMDGPRTYALLGQNSAELRPTGGFIGSMGLVTVAGGAIAVEDYRSSYAFDNSARGYPPLPPAMAAHLGGGGMAIRDANWSPDFPTSARAVSLLIDWHQDVAVDGVIAVTTFTVGALIDALGSVTVAGFAEPVTAQTWYEAAERLIYFPSASDTAAAALDPTILRDSERNITPRKEVVLEPIVKEVLRRVQAASPAELPAIARSLQTAIRRRELLLAFNEPAAAAAVRLAGADGRLRPLEGDVLALVDANLSYSKVGPHLSTRIVYDVTLDERGSAIESRATVSYENAVTEERARDPLARIGGEEWDAVAGVMRPNPGVYGTYARLYIPAGSRLLDGGATRPGTTVADELGLLALGRYERVPAGERRAFSHTYQLPPELGGAGAYRLRIVKQPGSYPLIEVRIHLPAGARATATPTLTRDGDTLVYRGTLLTTLDLHVALAASAR